MIKRRATQQRREHTFLTMKEHEVEEFYKYCLTGKHPAMGSLYVKDKKQTLTTKKKEGARKLLPGQKNILDFQGTRATAAKKEAEEPEDEQTGTVLKHDEAF